MKLVTTALKSVLTLIWLVTVKDSPYESYNKRYSCGGLWGGLVPRFVSHKPIGGRTRPTVTYTSSLA